MMMFKDIKTAGSCSNTLLYQNLENLLHVVKSGCLVKKKLAADRKPLVWHAIYNFLSLRNKVERFGRWLRKLNTSRVWLIGNSVISFFPIDQLNLDALKWGTDTAGTVVILKYEIQVKFLSLRE